MTMGQAQAKIMKDILRKECEKEKSITFIDPKDGNQVTFTSEEILNQLNKGELNYGIE